MCFCAVAVECYGALLLSLLESLLSMWLTELFWRVCQNERRVESFTLISGWSLFFSFCGLSFVCFLRTYKYKHHLNTNLSFAQARCCQMFAKWNNGLHLTLLDFVPIYPPIEWLFINFQFLPLQTLVLSTQMMVFDLSLLTFLSLCFVFPVVHSWHCS